MVKAHSLLYAIYICLLVSIICGAMLYFFNLYSILNLHYNLQEEIYIQNQSTVNFALGNKLSPQEIPLEENLDIENHYVVNHYGLLDVLITRSSFKNDTVVSSHLVGGFVKNKTAFYVSNFTQNLSYNGKVKIIGDCFFPTNNLSQSYLTNELNTLIHVGKKEISKITLPVINPKINESFVISNTLKSSLSEYNKVKDSIYFNSFTKPTQEINVGTILNSIIIKGNFILKNNDSIRISKNTILEDVIVMAPKISIENGFKGNAQFFATKHIFVEPNVTLNYPSAIVLKNESFEESQIEIQEGTKISGAVVLFGNSIENVSKNSITVADKTFLLGNIYCSGKLDLQGTVYGSVYANKVFRKTASAIYDNLISNFTIDVFKKPNYFIDFPLFEEDKLHYGIIKKVK